ncbi:ABC transporter ATP-binding protein [Pseudomarimonas arenosa]|uniref:ATP-binding cassette domain-containing protein n=1 Tax=Pseudomarimonas arenosa TaxID=2774145 RepID=A0AAW3ZID9_9GAMM|nr:ATP-binding cassette domain-containing protein [Pseudomarimonas arenosa]MBD8524474.1 ATP-binding cassette domain-containing protein [Pseudomarimonas arenosa]
MTLAIELRGLNKSFGSKQAVRGLDLEVPQGALYGIIGPNGAGKTTSLRMMLSILFPDSGSIRVLGADSALKAKDRIGYLPEERGVYRKMRVGDFLEHMAVLKGVPRNEAGKRISDWLERVGLADVAKKKCEELSKGMQQKVQFIAAVVHQPDLLILDEPFSGLDPVNMRLLKSLILEQHQRGVTVLFSTHVMPQAEQICQHIIMIHQGQKVLDDPLEAIRRRYAPHALLLHPIDDSADGGDLTRIEGIRSSSKQESGWRLELEPGHAPAEALRRVTQEIATRRIELLQPTLEDVFISLAIKDAPAAQEVIA